MEISQWSRTLRTILSVAYFLLAVVVFLIFLNRIAANPQWVDRWVILYALMSGSAAVLGFVTLVADFVRWNNDTHILARALFLFEINPLRPGSLFWGIPAAIFLALSVGLVLFVGVKKYALFSVIDPSTGLAFTSATATTLWDGLFSGAIIPGWAEEAAIFFGINVSALVIEIVLSFTLLRGWDVEEIANNPLVMWTTIILCTAVWSAVFAFGHARYGGDTGALISAGTFEFVVQFLNQITGSFLSWIPHMAHNAAVIGAKAYSFVVLS